MLRGLHLPRDPKPSPSKKSYGRHSGLAHQDLGTRSPKRFATSILVCADPLLPSLRDGLGEVVALWVLAIPARMALRT